MSDTFSDILNAPASDSVRPPALPAGHYLAMIKGLPRADKSAKKGTPFIEYTVSFLEPYTDAEGTTDIDAVALEEFGAVAGKEMKLTFYLTEGSAYRHKEFLQDDLGLDIEGLSHWEAAQQAAGAQFVAGIRHKPRDDGKGIFAEISGTAPVGQ